jgi:galactokinase/mevalonate kinase-like predicted kinase
MFVLNKPLINAARNFQDDAALKLCGSGGGGFVAAFVNQNKSDAFCDYLMQHKLTFHRV